MFYFKALSERGMCKNGMNCVFFFYCDSILPQNIISKPLTAKSSPFMHLILPVMN